MPGALFLPPPPLHKAWLFKKYILILNSLKFFQLKFVCISHLSNVWYTSSQPNPWWEAHFTFAIIKHLCYMHKTKECTVEVSRFLMKKVHCFWKGGYILGPHWLYRQSLRFLTSKPVWTLNICHLTETRSNFQGSSTRGPTDRFFFLFFLFAWWRK